MIITKKVNIKINSRNKKHYINIGYVDIVVGEMLLVLTIDLMRGSNIKIDCECDVCGKKNNISYKDYLKNIKKYLFYSCSKCSILKNKITNNNKYGCDFCLQNSEVKEKIKKTKKVKYGNEYFLNKEKYKHTMLEKYGVEYPSQNIKIKNKQIETNLKKYGVEYYTQTLEYKNKIKTTNLFLYGVEHTLQRDDVKIKRKDTMIKKYGVENPSQNKDLHLKQQKSAKRRKKYKDTNLHYQGTYELDFIESFYKKINIYNGPTIHYKFKECDKLYYSDFFIPECNLIVEIKSDYFYNLYLEKNLEKQKSCIEQDFNFLFIINKDYSQFYDFLCSFKYNSNDSGSPKPHISSTL